MKNSPFFSQAIISNRFLAMAFMSVAFIFVAFSATIMPAHSQDRVNSGLEVLRTSEVGATRRVELGLDKSLVIELPRDVRDVLVANPEVADAIVRTARKIFLIGNSVGQTNVFLFDGAGNTVLSLDLKVERDIGPLEELIEKYVPGSDVTVEIANDNVILTGTVPNPLAAGRAADLAQAFVTGGEATTGQFTQTATSGQNGGDSAISNPDDERAVSQVINLLRIEGEDQVHLKVVVAEIRRSVLKQLGVDLSATVGGATTAATLSSGAVAGAIGFAQPGGLGAAITRNFGGANVTAVIDALERANAIRTLAEPTLTAQSGREASFLAGGEIPIPTASTADDNGNVTVTTDFRPLGVSLSFTPVVQSPERISITVNTEVSEIDPTRALTFVGPTQIPSIAVRRASSTLELPSGGTMVLGGLLRDDIRQSSQGLPYLKNLPVLGPLFGSNNFIRNETELVIMVTPYLVRPTSPKKLTRPDKNYALNDDAKNFLMNSLNRLYGGKGKGAQGKYHGNVGFIYK